MTELSRLISRHCPGGVVESKIPRLSLSRSDGPSSMEMATPPPLFCVVASGRKRLLLGAEEFIYDAETYLITSADLPVSGHVVESPMLGLALRLDPAVIADLVVGMKSDAMSSRAMGVGVLDRDLLESVTRFVRLLDTPEHIAALAPLAEREILYRLLVGPKGEMLRQLALPTSHLSHIRKAIGFIRRKFDEPIRVSDLADLAGMSAPSFHRHFRSVTGMSPLQFQKHIRLQEARRRLLTEDLGAATIAMEVGYESPSQFSREYRRMFGAPPARETNLARTLAHSGAAR